MSTRALFHQVALTFCFALALMGSGPCDDCQQMDGFVVLRPLTPVEGFNVVSETDPDGTEVVFGWDMVIPPNLAGCVASGTVYNNDVLSGPDQCFEWIDGPGPHIDSEAPFGNPDKWLLQNANPGGNPHEIGWVFRSAAGSGPIEINDEDHRGVKLSGPISVYHPDADGGGTGCGAGTIWGQNLLLVTLRDTSNNVLAVCNPPWTWNSETNLLGGNCVADFPWRVLATANPVAVVTQ